MWQNELGPCPEPPELTAEQAIEIALSDSLSPPELSGLPVEAEYGVPLRFGYRGAEHGCWKIAVDVSSLGWETTYEGPGPKIVDGKMRYPNHVRVPRVRSAITIVDDKTAHRVLSATEPEPGDEHVIEWRRARETRSPTQRAILHLPLG